MSRTEPTNQEREQPLARRRVHLMLQAKGGIGKTYVARVLAERLNALLYALDSLRIFERCISILCIRCRLPAPSYCRHAANIRHLLS